MHHPLAKGEGTRLSLVSAARPDNKDGQRGCLAYSLEQGSLCTLARVHTALHMLGHQKVQPGERLAQIFSLMQRKYKRLESRARLTILKLSMFTDLKKPHAQPPSLQCKAAESKHLAPALLPVLKTLFEDSSLDQEVYMVQACHKHAQPKHMLPTQTCGYIASALLHDPFAVMCH